MAMTKTKKILLGIGMGCGGLALLASLTVFVVLMWGLNKIGNATTMVGDLVLQQKVLEELNLSFPYTPPEPGQALVLEESRFEQYLAIREQVLPETQAMRKRGEEMLAKSEAMKEDEVGPLDVLEAAEEVGAMTKNARNNLIQALAMQRMSPKEFLTITRAVYGIPAPDEGEDAGSEEPPPTFPEALRTKYQEQIARAADTHFDKMMHSLGTAASEGGLRVDPELARDVE